MSGMQLNFFDYMPMFLEERMCAFLMTAWPGKGDRVAEDDFDMVGHRIKELGVWKSYLDGLLTHPDSEGGKEMELMLVREHKEKNELSLPALMDALKKAEWPNREGDGEEVFYTAITISRGEKMSIFSIRPTQILKNNTEVELSAGATAGDELVVQGFGALRDAIEQMICGWFDGATAFEIGHIQRACGSGMSMAGRQRGKIYI